MRTFEYKVEVNLSDDESDVPTTALNRLGTVGWESAGVTSHVSAPLLMNEGPTKANRTGNPSLPAPTVMYFFKREKSQIQQGQSSSHSYGA